MPTPLGQLIKIRKSLPDLKGNSSGKCFHCSPSDIIWKAGLFSQNLQSHLPPPPPRVINITCKFFAILLWAFWFLAGGSNVSYFPGNKDLSWFWVNFYQSPELCRLEGSGGGRGPTLIITACQVSPNYVRFTLDIKYCI